MLSLDKPSRRQRGCIEIAELVGVPPEGGTPTLSNRNILENFSKKFLRGAEIGAPQAHFTISQSYSLIFRASESY